MKKFYHAMYAAAIAVLLILNAVIIIRIQTHKNRMIPENPSVVMGADGTVFSKAYFRQEMGFDNQQMDAFEEANALFKPKTQETIQQMDEINKKIRREMQRPTPNHEYLLALQQKAGQAYANLKGLTVDFYLQLKELCRPEQEAALKAVFAALFLAAPSCPNTPCLHAVEMDVTSE